MYHHDLVQSHQYDTARSSGTMDSHTGSAETLRFSRSPNAVTVTASASPNSPCIKFATYSDGRYRMDHPHDVDLQEYEAEVEYREYVMYQRIMEHRHRLSMSLPANADPNLLPPPMPLSTPERCTHPRPMFVSDYMLQRLRNNAKDQADSLEDENDQVDSGTNKDDDVYDDEDDDFAFEGGIFELDM
jgi:hypothetical protein